MVLLRAGAGARGEVGLLRAGNVRRGGGWVVAGAGCRCCGRSNHAPKGQKHPAQGKRAKRCDTLGLAGGSTIRPRRGQKQWQEGFHWGISRPRRLFHVRIGGFHVRIGGFKRFCRCFCPLHKIGCVRHSSSKLGSALTCTIFRGAR